MLCAVVNEIFLASCPSPAHERSVPTAKSLGTKMTHDEWDDDYMTCGK